MASQLIPHQSPPPQAAPARLGAWTRTISLAIAASRVLGFIRDLLIAKLFGTGIQAQAFVVAFRLPNLFRDLVAEGPMTTAVVPVLSRYRATQSSEEFWRLSQALAVRIGAVVGLLGLLGVIVAPGLVALVAPGFAGETEKFALTVRLTRILFPLITLVGLWAFLSGLLNSLHHFALPAMGPAALNLSMIAGCLWVVPHVRPGVIGLAWMVLAGGVIQLVMSIPVAAARGFRWRWIWHHEGSQDVMRLLAPRLVGAAVYQVSVLFDTVLASIAVLAGEGAIAALYFANRLVQLPLALFATASAQASLPTLSEHAARKDLHRFRATVLSLLRLVAFESLPAAVGLIVLAPAIVQTCFERGAFDRTATVMTAQTLSWLSIGLVAYAASKILSGAFYALHDTRTPVRLAMQAFGLNVVLAILFIGPLRIGGLALATALSSSVNAWRLIRALEWRLDMPLAPTLAKPIARMALAAALMGGGCWALWPLAHAHLHAVPSLAVVIAAGILVYGTACAVLGVGELARFLPWLATPRSPQPSLSA